MIQHTIGNVYKEDNTGDTYLLAQVDLGKVALIHTGEGNRYVKPVKLSKGSVVNDISPEDWTKVCNNWPEKFTCIGKLHDRRKFSG